MKKLRSNQKPSLLTDKITLRYNKEGNRYYTRTDFAEDERKTQLNLPTTKLYLLTADERKFYTVTADETKIRLATGGEYADIKEKVFIIPITVHNNSNDTLKYFSMSCSWQEFYHIDNKELDVFGSACDKNIPTEVVLQPHSAHTALLPFVYYKDSMKALEDFKVGLSINKNVMDDSFSDYSEELRLYNIVWSNEVQFTPK